MDKPEGTDEERKPVMGRPVQYKTAEELEKVAEDYFRGLMDEKGRWIRPPTVTGLALALDLTRKGLIDYEHKNKDFCNTITRAKQIVEAFNEESLLTGKNPNGTQFNMTNNFKGWKHKNETTIKTDTDLAEKILAARKRARMNEKLAGEGKTDEEET